jgi:hypothetical protein
VKEIFNRAIFKSFEVFSIVEAILIFLLLEAEVVKIHLIFRLEEVSKCYCISCVHFEFSKSWIWMILVVLVLLEKLWQALKTILGVEFELL